MKRIVLPGILVCGLIIASFTIRSKNKMHPAAGNGFAVVELFTSEGCSSCPPADKAVANLLTEYPDNVYVLGFHVDYWDYIGWKDAYSSHAYSNRQQQYGSKLGLSSIYTPQAIVNGTSEFTGSDTKQLKTRVEDGLGINSTAPVSITAQSTDGKTVTVNYTLQKSLPGVINIALVQLHAQSNVQRGENSGKLLQHVNVVRDFKTLPAKQPAGAISLTLPAGLTVKDCMIIAYTQDDSSWKITGAASANIQ